MFRIAADARPLAAGIALAISANYAHAAGYKIPENSVDSVALSAAYVANAQGADASYYNPAAMAFSPEGSSMEGALTYIYLPSIDFNGTQTIPGIGTLDASDKGKEEHIPVPSFHYISPSVGNARFGLSIIAPGGLTKRWDGYGANFAEEFTLKTVEVNPTASYKLTDNFSVGGGLRMIYSDGVVKSTSTLSRDLEGDSFDFGYNLAAHFQPTDNLAFSATYRSKVDLTVEGDARLSSGATTLYDGDASVSVPIPAALAIAAAMDITPDTTAEFVFERTYWSAYKNLDFDYSVPLSTINALLGAAFDDPIAKDWKDSNTYRFGLTHQLDDKWTLMAGFAIDKTPAPKQTIGFELPDGDAKIYSFGAKYKYSKQLEVGAAALYTDKDKVTLSAAANDNGLTGTFKGAGALLVTMGAEYRFD